MKVRVDNIQQHGECKINSNSTKALFTPLYIVGVLSVPPTLPQTSPKPDLSVILLPIASHSCDATRMILVQLVYFQETD